MLYEVLSAIPDPTLVSVKRTNSLPIHCPFNVSDDWSHKGFGAVFFGDILIVTHCLSPRIFSRPHTTSARTFTCLNVPAGTTGRRQISVSPCFSVHGTELDFSFTYCGSVRV